MQDNYILGGYTKRDNNGIYEIVFDKNKGSFKPRKLIAELDGPTFVALSQAKVLLFALHKEDNQGGIVAFRKKENQDWEEIDRLMGSDNTGCHISYREASQTIYVSNYHQGQIDIYKLEDDKLSHIQVIKHQGSSVHPNQDNSHVHYAGFNDNQSLLYVCDLGTDYVSTYRTQEDGTIMLASELKMDPGTGPRHLIEHPKEPYLYIIGELANTTTVASIDGEGKMAAVETVLNIPEEHTENAAGAAIRITSDGRFLYTSTRFHNVITVFEISEDGSRLTKIQEIDSHGEIPRDFNIDSSEKYLMAAHQDTDHISVFSRDAATGRLTFLENDAYAPECVCMTHA